MNNKNYKSNNKTVSSDQQQRKDGSSLKKTELGITPGPTPSFRPNKPKPQPKK